MIIKVQTYTFKYIHHTNDTVYIQNIYSM